MSNNNFKLEVKNSATGRPTINFYGDIVSSEWNKWIDEDTCPQDVQKFIKDLSSYSDVDININSGGGSVFGGIAIYNILKKHKGKKTVCIDGIAASIASVIAMAGDEITIGTGAMLMIHKPLTGIWGNATEMRKTADYLDTIENSMTEIYKTKTKTNITDNIIADMLEAETWMNGTEASEVFDIKVDEKYNAVAKLDDINNKNYKNIPKNIIKSEVVNVGIKEITEAIAKLADTEKEIVAKLFEKPAKVKTESEITAEVEAKYQAKEQIKELKNLIVGKLESKAIHTILNFAIEKAVESGASIKLDDNTESKVVDYIKNTFESAKIANLFNKQEVNKNNINKTENIVKDEYEVYKKNVEGVK